MNKNKYDIKTKSNDYWNNYYDGIQNMKKTRDPNSIDAQNAKTVIIDNDNIYYCYPVKLEEHDLHDEIHNIAENDFFYDLKIVKISNGFYSYEILDNNQKSKITLEMAKYWLDLSEDEGAKTLRDIANSKYENNPWTPDVLFNDIIETWESRPKEIYKKNEDYEKMELNRLNEV
tara:strand:+ start:512 stop:1033 length:522 start_codon:yes stop_codon:yes gene_type:complete